MKKFTLEQKTCFSKASTKLKSMEPVFKKLQLVYKKYIEREEGDYPHWYTERPHISLLAAAVWLSGGTALEEYKTNKIRKGKANPGRCDIGIRNNKRIGFECEAKHLRLNLRHKTEVLIKKLESGLTAAGNDIRSHRSKEGLAICFAIPVVRETKSKVSTADTKLRNLLKLVEESYKTDSFCDAVVWIGFKNAISMGKGHRFLGLLLAIKEVP